MNELQTQIETHAPGEGDPRADSIVYIGVIGVILTAVSALLLAGLHYDRANYEFERKAASAVFADTIKLANDQRAVLHQSYTWVDRANNIVAIPIERAMELTIQDLNRKEPEKSSAKGEIEGAQ